MQTSRQHPTRAGSHGRRAAGDLLTTRDVERALARVAWQPALNEYWLRNADQDALLDAWSAARAWCEEDLGARSAIGLLEDRLTSGIPAASRVRLPAQRDPA